METYVLEHSDEIIFNVHLPNQCTSSRQCPIHNKTNHHLRHLPQHWNDKYKAITRICEHGLEHADPDDPSAFYINQFLLPDECVELPKFNIRDLGLPEDLQIALQDGNGQAIKEADGSDVIVPVNSELTKFLLKTFYAQEFNNWLQKFIIETIERAIDDRQN